MKTFNQFIAEANPPLAMSGQPQSPQQNDPQMLANWWQWLTQPDMAKKIGTNQQTLQQINTALAGNNNTKSLSASGYMQQQQKQPQQNQQPIQQQASQPQQNQYSVNNYGDSGSNANIGNATQMN